MVAALIADHEHHQLASPRLAADSRIPAIVLAETFSQLRRTFGQPAQVAVRLLRPWSGMAERILPTTTAAVASTFARATELDLAGSIHDALIAQVCIDHGVGLVTLRWQAAPERVGARGDQHLPVGPTEPSDCLEHHCATPLRHRVGRVPDP